MTEGVHSDCRVPSLEADFDGGGPGGRQGSGGRRSRVPGMTGKGRAGRQEIPGQARDEGKEMADQVGNDEDGLFQD